MCLARYLHPKDHYPVKITKTDKDFAGDLDLKSIKLPVKIRDIHKIGWMNSITISVVNYENKLKYQICVWKECCFEKMLICYWYEEWGEGLSCQRF